MRIFVEHDSKGKVMAAGISTNPSMGMALKPRRGHRVTEFDVEEIQGHKDHEHLRKVVDTYRVQTVDGKPKLVRKSK